MVRAQRDEGLGEPECRGREDRCAEPSVRWLLSAAGARKAVQGPQPYRLLRVEVAVAGRLVLSPVRLTEPVPNWSNKGLREGHDLPKASAPYSGSSRTKRAR